MNVYKCSDCGELFVSEQAKPCGHPFAEVLKFKNLSTEERKRLLWR